MANFAGTCTSDNKGLLLLLLNCFCYFPFLSFHGVGAMHTRLN